MYIASGKVKPGRKQRQKTQNSFFVFQRHNPYINSPTTKESPVLKRETKEKDERREISGVPKEEG